MVMPNSYNETPLGVFSDGWKYKKASACMRIETGSRNTEHKKAGGKYPFFVRSQEIERIDSYKYDCEAVLTAGDGVGTGKVFHYIHGKFDAHQRVYVMSEFSDVSGKYFYYYFSNNFFSEVAKYTAKSSVDSVRRNMIADMLLPLPSISEQTAIAEALSDADSLIASLEKLIAKKKAIKQGAMQELLTGKKRLPGFSGEWVEKSLGDLFAFSGGISASRDQLSSKGNFYLHYGDIHAASKAYVDTVEDAFCMPKLETKLSKVPLVSLLKDGDVVFVDASEDNEGASKHVVIRNEADIAYIAGLHTIVAKSLSNDVQNRYKEYCFKTESIKTQFKYYCAGTKVTGISKTNIAKINLIYPIDLEEQTAIAYILSDMDAEIEQLEKKLTKYRLIKQGMMQELLTGRIRLVESVKKTSVIAIAKDKPVPKGHNPKYEDAVAISAIVNAFYDDRFILGRKKVQKLLYLLRRKQDADVSAFKKKAAGPYNEKVRYNGGESIAVKEGYIDRQSGNSGSKFSKGKNIGVALQYVGSIQADIEWLFEKFRYYNTNDNKESNNLEVLATVDMAVCELDKTGRAISVNAVKEVIRSNKEWAPKLKKPCFTDMAIQKAMIESKELFG